jgi:phage-related protein
MTVEPVSRELIWIGSARRDFSMFPPEVKAEMGYALFVAQAGGRHRKAKILKGFGGAGVIELIADHRGDTFRTVYAVRFGSAVYALHAFQKKSKTGIATPQADIRLIEQRLKEAERLHRESDHGAH